tara:strand:- start:1123 stop:3861 length:2739 start_codon:yes stop_codon:yes gene_type:complete
MVIVRVAEADGSAVSTTNHALMTSFIEDSYLDSTSGNEGDTNGGDANFTIRKTGASTEMRGIVRINLPARPDPTAGPVHNVRLRLFSQSASGSAGTEHISWYRVTNTQWIEGEVSWTNYKTGTGWETAGGQYDTTTDYGLGGAGIVSEQQAGDATNSVWHTYDLKPLIDSSQNTFDWGDSINLLGIFDGGASADFNTFFSSEYATAQYRAYVTIDFDNPTPEPPFIKVIPDEDGITPKVYVEKHSIASPILRYSVGWDDVITDLTHGGTGVDMTDSDTAGLGSQPTIIPASKLTTTTLLAVEDTNYSVAVWAEKLYNQNADGGKSNQVSLARPKIDTTSGTSTHSGVVTTGTTVAATKTVDVGELVQIRIKGTSTAHSGKIKRFWINWEANISDTDADYGLYEVDEAIDGDTTVTSKYFTHRYDRDEASNYTVKVKIEDEDGFRSGTSGALGTLIATITVSTPAPVAKIQASRDVAIEAVVADINNTIILSGQQSYTIGSNRKVKFYKYKHNSNDPLTTFPTDNDNSSFNAVSDQVRCKCSILDCAGTNIRVFGPASVNDAGGAVVDSASDFSHYVWLYSDISPSNTVNTYGSASGNFFKRVDFIVITSLDGDDTGGYYTVKNNTTGGIINNKLAGVKNTYKWGGHAVLNPDGDELPQNLVVAVSSNVITADGGGALGTATFLTDGFRVGDIVVITGMDEAANNGSFTISAVTNTTMTLTGATMTNDGGSVCQIYKDGSTLVSIPVAAYDDGDYTITHLVVDDNDQAATAATKALTFRTDAYFTLDLDTQVSAGNIALLSANLSRKGGVVPVMPTGNRRYPLGHTRTKLGVPTLAVTVRIINQEGLRNIWSLIEGDRFLWAVLDSKRIDSPMLPYRDLRLKLLDGGLNKDPSTATQYIANLNFVVIGEEQGA